MHATTPPRENQIATRAAILNAARAKLTPVFEDADALDALPAWLWSLPAQVIAKCRITLELLDLLEERRRRSPGELLLRRLVEPRLSMQR